VKKIKDVFPKNSKIKRKKEDVSAHRGTRREKSRKKGRKRGGAQIVARTTTDENGVVRSQIRMRIFRVLQTREESPGKPGRTKGCSARDAGAGKG
jgi:hypothetical protein